MHFEGDDMELAPQQNAQNPLNPLIGITHMHIKLDINPTSLHASLKPKHHILPFKSPLDLKKERERKE